MLSQWSFPYNNTYKEQNEVANEIIWAKFTVFFLNNG